MTKNYKYKFSFVIPIYNVEAYLAETVESILAQSMDFEQNCEIIFVNDGSPDNSEAICLHYKERFPENITYIVQENAGPGPARNRGIAKAHGKYISLLDSDDKISPNTLDEVYRFFEQHYDEIDFVSIKQKFFEAREGNHPLNYKFTRDRVIDLEKEFDAIQMSAPTSFFKAEVLQQHPFEASIGRYAEDSRLMAEIALIKRKFGVVTKPIYFYRKRSDQASSLDSTLTDKFWYLETPKRAWEGLFKYTQKQQGEIPKFIQFMVMYDLQWRFKQTSQTALNEKEVKQYKNLLYGLLKYIDGDVIMAQRNIELSHKLFVLSKKHGQQIALQVITKNQAYFYNEQKIYDMTKMKPEVHLEFIEIKNGMVCIEGFLDGVLFNNARLLFRTGSGEYEVELVDRVHNRTEFLGDIISSGNSFKTEIPLQKGMTICAHISDGSMNLRFRSHRFSGLSPSVERGAYCVRDEFIIRRIFDQIHVQKRTALRRLSYEFYYGAVLLKRLKLRVTFEQYNDWKSFRDSGSRTGIRQYKWMLIPAKSAARNVYVVGFRFAYFIVKSFHKQPIWILMDRTMEADDSGEIMFRFLNNKKDLRASIHFVISKKSRDFTRLKQYGKVANFHSLRYKLLFLLSDKIISSEAADYVINAFGGRADDVLDLYDFDFVFLQHGIIKDDISGWLNRYQKNIKLFITSTKPEQESLIKGNYGYDKTVVKLTGLPRYDLLENMAQKKIIITPTWRQDLAGSIDPITGQRLYNPAFNRSAYFKFYQDLMNDSRLLAIMKQRGYHGEFYLHHSFRSQITDFVGNDSFKIMQMPFDYPKAKREGSLLLTDYSSVAFDFAYLKKPVLYTHFDEDSFYKIHTGKEGYFSYESDGFGPVTYNYEDTVKQMIAIIEGGTTMLKKYQNRVEKFFYKFDRNNSERVYQAILEMDNQR